VISSAVILDIVAGNPSVAARGDDRHAWYKPRMRSGPPRRRPARPVADVPVEALVERSEDVAKGWLLALVEQEPLAAAPSILAAELAQDGPAICAALVRALASDAELERISAGGELDELVSRTGEVVGANTAETALRAVDALRAIVWSALLGSLADPDASLVAEVAERLALVCEHVRGAALRPLSGGRGHRLLDVPLPVPMPSRSSGRRSRPQCAIAAPGAAPRCARASASRCSTRTPRTPQA
jgi:hypothetical protein